MQFIPTNDVFHHLIKLLRLNLDRALVLDMFESQGIEVSNAKIKSWKAKAGYPKQGYREMPREVLDAFINERYKRKLIGFD
ncbi:DUF1456 family protein (plasmid) [Proteus mirabilis]|uniref:hypothetical protein n=1 Tax=Proteus mirabilis TaxID=584 RepID=UPI0038F7CDB4